MSIKIDTCGLSCPQPVLMFVNAVKENPESEFEVLVNTDASRENVTRAAQNRGFQVQQEEADAGVVRLLLSRK